MFLTNQMFHWNQMSLTNLNFLWFLMIPRILMFHLSLTNLNFLWFLMIPRIQMFLTNQMFRMFH
jgi:hypothetical protein